MSENASTSRHLLTAVKAPNSPARKRIRTTDNALIYGKTRKEGRPPPSAEARRKRQLAIAAALNDPLAAVENQAHRSDAADSPDPSQQKDVQSAKVAAPKQTDDEVIASSQDYVQGARITQDVPKDASDLGLQDLPSTSTAEHSSRRPSAPSRANPFNPFDIDNAPDPDENIFIDRPAPAAMDLSFSTFSTPVKPTGLSTTEFASASSVKKATKQTLQVSAGSLAMAAEFISHIAAEEGDETRQDSLDVESSQIERKRVFAPKRPLLPFSSPLAISRLKGTDKLRPPLPSALGSSSLNPASRRPSQQPSASSSTSIRPPALSTPLRPSTPVPGTSSAFSTPAIKRAGAKVAASRKPAFVTPFKKRQEGTPLGKPVTRSPLALPPHPETVASSPSSSAKKKGKARMIPNPPDAVFDLSELGIPLYPPASSLTNPLRHSAR